MFYQLVFLPVYISLAFALQREYMRGHRGGLVTLFIIGVTLAMRFLMIGMQYDGMQLTGAASVLNDMTLLFIMPTTYMYLCNQCGTRWYNNTARILVALILFAFIPDPFAEYDEGGQMLRELICIVQCLILVFRMWVLYKRVYAYGLKFSAVLKNYYAWMGMFLTLTIIMFANGEFISSSEPVHWLVFAAYSIVITWGFVFVAARFDISPIVTENDEAVQLDTFIENTSRLAERLHQLLDDEKVYLRQGLVIDEMAKLLGTNRTYFTRLMRQEYNQTFHDYVNNARVAYSKELLLKSDMSLEHVAMKCGFPGASAYCRTFKRLTEKTPTQWKSEMYGQRGINKR